MTQDRNIEFVCTGGPYGDQCYSYDVKGFQGMTVAEFINYMLELNPEEWGYFETPVGTVEYRYGELLHATLCEPTPKISKITSHGGWSRMDYKIS